MLGRRALLGGAAAALLGSHARFAQAGAQVEEPLADSVRSALSLAVSAAAPLEPHFPDTEARLAYLRWLGAMSPRLVRRKVDWQERKEFLQGVWYESKRAGLDTSLVLGLIQVESNFRKFAVSSAGARGYMQVMPFWTRLIGRPGDNLFHVRLNVRYGCVILRYYLDIEKGDYYRALGRYNGSLGKPEYPNLVLSAWKGKWGYAGATS